MLSFLVLFSFSSCEKLEVPEDTPSCIKKKIRKSRSDRHSCTDWVYRYEYKGNSVYLFADNGNCADAGATVYNEDCEVVCTMGGISGNGDGRCPDFETHAFNEELIWNR